MAEDPTPSAPSGTTSGARRLARRSVKKSASPRAAARPAKRGATVRRRRAHVISQNAAQDALLLLNQAAKARSEKDATRLAAMAHKRLQDG